MISTKHTILTLSLLTLVGVFFTYQNLLPELKMTAMVAQSEALPKAATAEVVIPSISEGTLSNETFTDFLSLTSIDDIPPATSSTVENKVTVTDTPIAPSQPEIPLTKTPLTLNDQLHEKSTQARRDNGLPALIVSTQLSQSAQERSDDMTEYDYLSHTSLSGCNLTCHWNESGIDTLTWGENLAEFTPYSEALSNIVADTLITRWLESSGHRQNLLSSSFTHYGIGISVKGERLVVTVIFGNL